MFNTKSLELFRKKFNEQLIKECKGKKILVLLSGGLDSRAILSTLSMNDIDFHALTHSEKNKIRKDIKISKKIFKKNENIKKHHILFFEDKKDLFIKYREITKDYDIILNGILMSGLFDKYEHIELSEKELNKRIRKEYETISSWKQHFEKMYFPAESKEIIQSLEEIPIFYRFFHFPQKYIIEKNKKDLMKIEYTTYNVRKRFFRLIH